MNTPEDDVSTSEPIYSNDPALLDVMSFCQRIVGDGNKTFTCGLLMPCWYHGAATDDSLSEKIAVAIKVLKEAHTVLAPGMGTKQREE